MQVPVIYVRVKANIPSPTFDELNLARKQSQISSFRSQNRDTVADIRKMCNERRSDFILRLSANVISDSLLSELEKVTRAVHSVDSVEIAFEAFQSVISQECGCVLQLHLLHVGEEQRKLNAKAEALAHIFTKCANTLWLAIQKQKPQRTSCVIPIHFLL